MIHAVQEQPIKEFSRLQLTTSTYDFSKLIGAGGFGAVYEGTDKGVPVVVKVLHQV